MKDPDEAEILFEVKSKHSCLVPSQMTAETLYDALQQSMTGWSWIILNNAMKRAP